jgi:hypothetical protein
VKTILFLAALGGGYGIAHALGASEGWAAGAGWALAGLVFLIGRRRGYRAAIRVERWRAAAMHLRTSDPATYEQILAQADSDPQASTAAARDPDAYVAIFLSIANEST